MNLHGVKVLVTGAEGFIGSHLTEALVREGCSVRGMVWYNALGSWGWLDAMPFDIRRELEVVMADIRDVNSVRAAVDGCSVVFHLAALIGIPYSYRAPESYIDTNVHGTLNIVQAARELNVEKVIHTSTSEVYGTAQIVPIDENHPLRGQSPYAASKIGADQIAMSYYYSFSTPVAIARPFNTYGPRQSARAVIPTIIMQIASGVRSLRLGATQPTRDFNFVDDTVSGFIAIAKSGRTIGETVNIGSGYEISVGDTARLIADEFKADCEIETDESRLRPERSEVERLCANNERARTLTGWEPMYGGRDGLRAGIAITRKWFEEPANLARYRVGDYVL
jgi:NAD dependent epimerase/dehydratase